MKNIIINHLKDKNYNLTSSDSNGINVISSNNEIIVKGSKLDLIELADYILSVALSEHDTDHIHLDNLTLLDNNSDIRAIIIEKY